MSIIQRPISSLLRSPDKWSRYFMFRNEQGDAVSKYAHAHSYCLIGALFKSSLNEHDRLDFEKHEKLHVILFNAVKQCFPDRLCGIADSIANFNDHSKTTFEDVQKVLDLAQL